MDKYLELVRSASREKVDEMAIKFLENLDLAQGDGLFGTLGQAVAFACAAKMQAKKSLTAPDLTLRDKFADTALRGLIGSSIALHYSPNEYAATAYMIADAMIAERAK